MRTVAVLMWSQRGRSRIALLRVLLLREGVVRLLVVELCGLETSRWVSILELLKAFGFCLGINIQVLRRTVRY
jgi:hypothetical protein